MTISQRSSAERFGFDLTRSVVADVEVYPDRWCVGFLGPNRDGILVNKTIEDRKNLARVLDTLTEHGRTLVTYNGDHYDVPVIHAILGGLDPYAVSCSIIADERAPKPLSSLPPLGCDHIDLSARLRRGGRIPSLKLVAAYMGRPTLRELPYAPGRILTDAEWGEVKAYNRIDLDHTRALLVIFAPELKALAALSEEQGQDLRSQPSPRVVERVFLSAYRQQRGLDPIRPETPHEVLYRALLGVRRPVTPEAAAWYDRVVGVPLPMVGPQDL
jgi:hypothetical protein